MDSSARIAVVGLGYVGLPLSVALARHYEVIGFDINPDRVRELGDGVDRTGEIERKTLLRADLSLTAISEEMSGFDIFIVTVPTPIDSSNEPNLGPLEAACKTIAPCLTKGAIVVLESTVYPGVTEEVCGPLLAKGSGLSCGEDFFLGYSPERINPGDSEHTVDRITKVIAGQTPEVCERLKQIYGRINSGRVFLARDIKTAEAAKVIENSQRDINIAFINEVAMICHKMDISIHDVLDAARTKWNFMPFKPGLVGGHCIGVDPFYLAYRAEKLGHDPQVILAGRRTNDGMGEYVVSQIEELIRGSSQILVLGLAFKENVPDLRNTKAVDLIRGLSERGHSVDVHDPIADPVEAKNLYGIDLLPSLNSCRKYDCVVGAVSHETYRSFRIAELVDLLVSGGLVADVQAMWCGLDLPSGVRRWQL
tara:strand:+ start:10077 stop:11345 length:1269 start_codon:yes stop_codon:yes gene_type:complete